MCRFWVPSKGQSSTSQAWSCVLVLVFLPCCTYVAFFPLARSYLLVSFLACMLCFSTCILHTLLLALARMPGIGRLLGFPCSYQPALCPPSLCLCIHFPCFSVLHNWDGNLWAGVHPLTSGLVDIRDLGLLRLFEFLFLYGLMALTHRWQNRHLGVPLNSVFPGWTFETSGVIVFWVSFFVARPDPDGPHPSVAKPPPWLLVLLVPFPGDVKLSGWALVVQY